MGRLSPLASLFGLSAAAAAVLLGVALAFHFSGGPWCCARGWRSRCAARELEGQHRALSSTEALQRLEAAHARLAQAVDQAAEAIASPIRQGSSST